MPLPFYSHFSDMAVLLGLKIQKNLSLSFSTCQPAIPMDPYNVSLFVKPRIHVHENMVKRHLNSLFANVMGKFCDGSQRPESLRVLYFS